MTAGGEGSDQCRAWLDTEPRPVGSFIPVEVLYPSTKSDRDDIPFSSLSNSAKSGCKGCHLLATGASLFAQSLGREQDLKSIRFDNRGTHLSAKLVWREEETPGKIHDTVDRSKFEYYINRGRRRFVNAV
jgi:hypothetical protein